MTAEQLKEEFKKQFTDLACYEKKTQGEILEQFIEEFIKRYPMLGRSLAQTALEVLKETREKLGYG